MSPMKSKKFVKSFIKADADILRSFEPAKEIVVNNNETYAIDNSKKAIVPIYPVYSDDDVLYVTGRLSCILKQYLVKCKIKCESPEDGIYYMSEDISIVTSSPKNIPELAKKQVASFSENWNKYRDKSPTLDGIISVFVRLRNQCCGDNIN